MASVMWVPFFFCASIAALYVLSNNSPQLSSDIAEEYRNTSIKFPSSIEELKMVAGLLNVYNKEHSSYVLLLFGAGYLFKQTFSIPGSVFLNLLAGALFKQWLGFALASTLTACGASCCFLLSKFFGKEYIMRKFPEKIQVIHSKFDENKDSLFFFLLFLRLFPMAPNWFMNIAAPICNVPLHLFFLSVFIGLMPYNFICVQTGSMLSSLESVDDIFTLWTLGKLLLIANVALIPGLIIKHYHDNRVKSKKAL